MLSQDRAIKNARLVKQLNLLGVAVPPPDDFDDAVEIAAAKTKEANNLLKSWIRKPKKTVQVDPQEQNDEAVNNSGEIERPRSPTQIQQEEDAKSAIDLAQRVLRALNYDYRITNMESRVQNAALSAADFAKEKLAKAMKELLHESEDSHGDLEEETNYQSATTLADAAIERVIQFYTSLDITLSDRNLLKAPPGMTTRSMPVAPEVPESLAQTPKLSNEPPPVPPSRAVRTDAPPSGMAEVNHEEEMRDRAASSDSSTSGMDRSPPPIPSQTLPFDSVGLSDTETESYRDVSVSTDSEENSGMPYSPPPVPAVQKARRLFNDENFNKWLDNLADNAAYQVVDLGSLVKGVKNALNADVQASEWHDNLYTAVANFVYSVFNLRDDKTQQYTIKNFFELFVSSRSYTELYEPTKALFDLMKVLSDMPGGKDENISVNFKSKVQKDLEDAGINNEYFISESDVDDKVSVKDIAAAMEPAIITVESHMALKDSIAQLREAKRGVNRNSTSTRIAFEEETEQFFPEDSEFLKPEGYNKIIADPKRFHELESVDEIDPEDVEDKQVYEELKAAKPPTSILKTSPNYVPQSERDRSSSIPSLESDDELEHDSTELNATVDNGEDRLSHNVQENPTTPIPEEFWTSPHDTLAEVYLAMLGEDATKGFEDYFTREDLHERIKAFIDACETYFDSETPSADDARYLKETFDYALDPINTMIDHNTEGLEDKNWSNYRRDLKSYVADQLAELVSNTLNHTHSRAITRDEINGAISLQRVVLAESIMSSSDTVESGGGGYCGDRSIIQSLREAIRSGAISIPEDHELHAILQQRRGSIVGKEEVVSEADAKAFRRLYVNYLKRANEPYVESLMAAGILNVNLDTVGDQENVYWLTDIDMKYISKWLKVNLNVVQNVGDRDDTFSYKPEVDAESIGTINIFNQGYENQDGIHYQALLPKSRTNIKDDYVDVELEKMIASDDENSSNEFEKISMPGASSDEELLGSLAEEPLNMPEISQSATTYEATKTEPGRLTAEQLAAIAGIDPRNRLGQEASRSTSPEEPNAAVSNKRGGFLSGLKNKVLNNKKASSPKTATVEPKRPARDPLREELVRNQRFQEQQRQESALFGAPSEQRNYAPPNVTPVQENVSSAGLRKRFTSATSRESTNRVQDSTPAPKMPANKRPAKTPFAGFVGVAPESLRETLVQQNSSEDAVTEEQTPVVPAPSNRTNSSRVVEPEDTALESEVVKKLELDIHEIPRPVAPKSLVAMVRYILDNDNNNTGLDYVDTKIATKIEIVTKDDVPVQVATITDRKYDDPPGKLGTVIASGISGKDTYDAMSATLKLIAAMPDAERAAYIHPVTVRNITTREQVIGATRALYEYCVQVSGSTLAAEQTEALKDIYINNVGADKFKQALYEFLRDMPDDVYSDAYTQSGYKAFTEGLLTSTPEVSIVTGSRGLGTHPPRTQRDPEFKPLFGLLHNYAPPKSFMGSMLNGVKRAFISDQDNGPNSKNRRV